MTAPLRIAVFAGTFPVISETFIIRQIVGLLRLGHDVRIFADTRPEAGAPVHPQVAEHRLLERTTYMDMPPESAPWEMPVRPLFGRTWPPGSPHSISNAARVTRALPQLVRCFSRHPRLARQLLRGREYGYRAESLSGLYRLDRMAAQSTRFDVLHAHFGPVGNSFRFVRDLFHAPLIVSFHGYDFCTVPRKEGAGVYSRLFQAADLITVNSDYTRKRVQQLGCPDFKIRKLPMGLDLEEFPFHARVSGSGETIRIVTVARLVQIKGHEYVLNALARLKDRFPHLRYDIVGDGPLRSKLTQLAEQLGIAGMVRFHGALSGVDTAKILGAAHIFVLTSASVDGDEEGQGLALQEAQASGLPVIATHHGGFPEGLQDGVTGFLVEQGNADSLAQRLAGLIGQPENWADIGSQGRRFVEDNFDIRKLSLQLANVYHEAIARFRTN